MNDIGKLSEHEEELLSSFLLRLCDSHELAEPLLRRKLFHAEREANSDINLCATLHLKIGKVCLYQGRTLEALSSFKRALDLSRRSNNPDTHDYVRRFRLMFEMSA
jgi:hypothetical protein